MGLAAALLSSAIQYSLEMIALKSIPANTLGVLLSIEAAVGAIIDAIVLGKLLTCLQWLAVTLIVGAWICMVLTSKAVRTPWEPSVWAEARFPAGIEFWERFSLLEARFICLYENAIG